MEHSHDLADFPQFSRLPFEIREMIWKESLETRLVCRCGSTRRRLATYNHYADQSARCSTIFRSPALFFVNLESHNLAKRLYGTYKREDREGRISVSEVFNPDIDVAVLHVDSVWKELGVPNIFNPVGGSCGVLNTQSIHDNLFDPKKIRTLALVDQIYQQHFLQDIWAPPIHLPGIPSRFFQDFPKVEEIWSVGREAWYPGLRDIGSWLPDFVVGPLDTLLVDSHGKDTSPSFALSVSFRLWTQTGKVEARPLEEVSGGALDPGHLAALRAVVMPRKAQLDCLTDIETPISRSKRVDNDAAGNTGEWERIDEENRHDGERADDDAASRNSDDISDEMRPEGVFVGALTGIVFQISINRGIPPASGKESSWLELGHVGMDREPKDDIPPLVWEGLASRHSMPVDYGLMKLRELWFLLAVDIGQLCHVNATAGPVVCLRER